MVYMFLAQGFEESEALVTADILRRARITVALCAVGCASNDGYVTGSHDISVRFDEKIEDGTRIREADMLILPGGQPGVDNLWESMALRNYLLGAAKDGKYIAAICAAPLILGRLGLLGSRRATCYPGYEHELAGADVKNTQSVCADGKIITARAAGSVFDFALALVDALRGQDAAEGIRKSICYAPPCNKDR